jgi:hypothetical protein
VFIVTRSLARQGFEEYISGKLPLFFSLPHRNEKSQYFYNSSAARLSGDDITQIQICQAAGFVKTFFVLPTFHLSPKIFCSRKLADKSPLVKGYNRRLTQKFIKLGYE